MSESRVRLALDGAVATLTVDRPEARNALDADTVRDFHEGLDRVEADAAVRAVIVTGAGSSVFVAGADVRTLLARSTADVLAAANNRLFARIESLAMPTIAAINGWALGGGLELALACDVRIASAAARLGLPETGLGILPGAGGTQRLPRIVGAGHAREMVLFGTIHDAETAARIGLVNRVVTPEELMPAAHELADRAAKRAPVATRLAKLALAASANVPADWGARFEIVAQAVLNSTSDMREGMTAFLEKRPAGFRGE